MKRERIPEVHFYEWRVNAWRTSDARRLLDGTGRGIYRELLDTCYTQGSILNPETEPAYMEAHARDCAVSLEQFQSSWRVIKRYFQVSKNDATLLTNPQANLARREYFRYVEGQRKRRKDAWAKRADAQLPDKSKTSDSPVEAGTRRGRSAKLPNGNGERTATARQTNGDGESAHDSPPPLAWIKSFLTQFVREGFGFNWPPPDDAIVRKVQAACHGHTGDELQEFLQQLHSQGRSPAKNYAWFVPVIAGRFGGENGGA